MMVKTDAHCGIELQGIEGDYRYSLKSTNYLPLNIIPNKWTELEFEISDKVVNEVTMQFPEGKYAKNLVGYQLFVYPYEEGTEDLLYQESDMPKKPVTLWIDWVEVGSEVGNKNFLKPVEKPRDYMLHGNYPMENHDGYIFNFGTTGPETYNDDCLLAVGIQNIFEEPIDVSLERDDFVDQNTNHKYGNGAIKYVFNGSQMVEGYIAMKFNQKDDCLHKDENPIDLSNVHHRKIRALIKATEPGYIRIFGGILDSSYNEPRLNSLIFGNGVFNDSKKLTPGEWQIVEFEMGTTSEDEKLYTDFSEMIGVTLSVTTKTTDTGLPYSGQLLVDWIEVGSAIGRHQDIYDDAASQSFSGNEELEDGGFDFGYADIDTADLNLYSLQCLPADSISNDVFNTSNVDDVKIGFTREGVEDHSGALNINFENLTNQSDWVEVRFTDNNCNPLNYFGLDFSDIAVPSLVGNVRSNQNVKLEIGLLRRGVTEYEVYNILDAGIELQADTWTEISIDLIDIFNGLDLTNLVGVTYRITPLDRVLKTIGSTTLQIDELKIGQDGVITTEESSDKEITVYPNPASSELFIHGINEKTSVELLDVVGNVVIQTTENTIDVSGLNSGMYFVRISQDEEVIKTTKILVE